MLLFRLPVCTVFVVLGGGEVVEGLVRSPRVVVIDPGPPSETGVFDGLEAPRPAELLLHRRKRWRIQDPPARVPMVSIRPFLQWCLQRSVTPAINPRP